MIEDRMFYQSLLERERSWLLRTDVHVLYLRKKATMLSVVVFLCIVAILRTDSWERILPILIGLWAAYAAVMRYRMLAYILKSTRETTDAQIETQTSRPDVAKLVINRKKRRIFRDCGHLDYSFRMSLTIFVLIGASILSGCLLKYMWLMPFFSILLILERSWSFRLQLFLKETAETTNGFVESKRGAI